MDLSSPHTPHMPNSVFPDIPESTGASTSAPISSESLSNARPSNDRRLTIGHIPTRREARPLRSSPLAGPSLKGDGIPKEPSPGNQSRPQRPLPRTISTPDVSTRVLIAGSIVQSPIDCPSSPTNSSDGGHALSAPEAHNSGHGSESTLKTSRFRRLSLKLTKRAVQTPPPRLGDVQASNHIDHSPPPSPRSRTLSGPTSPKHEVPPVPDLPFWARASRRQSTSSGDPPRPSTAPTTPVTSQASKRRSTAPAAVAGSEAHVMNPVSLQNLNMPSTSRDPEKNWLTTASTPRFSRLSLKAEGVVLPVSVKEARRRSTVSLSSRASVDSKSMKGKQSTRSLRSIGGPSSETARRLAMENDVQPPYPPFRAEANISSSSLASSTLGSIAESDLVAPGSVAFSRSSFSNDDLPAVPRIGTPYTTQNKSASTVELVLRVNDVTVDVIGFSEEEAPNPAKPHESHEPRKPPQPDPYALAVKEKISNEAQPRKADLGRRRTLKQVWKRVVKSVAG